MKVFAIIFSMYLLAMMLLPCTDAPQSVPQNETAKITLSQNQDHHFPTKDLCGSLCTCSCCGSTISSPTNAQVVIKEPQQTQKQLPFIEAAYVSDFYGSTWRPPIFS